MTSQAGGLVTSEEDERVQVVVPQGAVSKNTRVQVQVCRGVVWCGVV